MGQATEYQDEDRQAREREVGLSATQQYRAA
jgi:hypothetical protein